METRLDLSVDGQYLIIITEPGTAGTYQTWAPTSQYSYQPGLRIRLHLFSTLAAFLLLVPLVYTALSGKSLKIEFS